MSGRIRGCYLIDYSLGDLTGSLGDEGSRLKKRFFSREKGNALDKSGFVVNEVKLCLLADFTNRVYKSLYKKNYDIRCHTLDLK